VDKPSRLASTREQYSAKHKMVVTRGNHQDPDKMHAGKMDFFQTLSILEKSHFPGKFNFRKRDFFQTGLIRENGIFQTVIIFILERDHFPATFF